MSISALSLKIATDERFDRLERIEWWDQSRLRDARVLVVGAGALGNEVIKNLALLGIGHLVVVDRDCIELSNLSRSVLFRPSDTGRPKAECAVRAATSIYPSLRARAVHANVVAALGLGYVRWADVVVGALDNREARVFVNSVCARIGKPWIDGGIDVFQGVVRGFAPPATSCYECTMSQVDWDTLNQRRSCSLLARRANAHGGTPTTPITASIVGALQAQEVVKILHGMDALIGKGYVFNGGTFQSYPITFPVNPECPWHEGVPCRIVAAVDIASDSTLRDAWRRAEEHLGTLDAIDFVREIVDTVRCASCGREERLLVPADDVTEKQVVCRKCGTECTPTFLHSVGPGSDLLDAKLRDIGLPLWDVIWARADDRYLGIEIAGDRPLDLERRDDGATAGSPTVTSGGTDVT